jgi:hypothetical protein
MRSCASARITDSDPTTDGRFRYQSYYVFLRAQPGITLLGRSALLRGDYVKHLAVLADDNRFWPVVARIMARAKSPTNLES